MKHILPCLLTIAATGTFSACSKDKPAEVDLGYDYFPQNIGHWIEYQVDSMRVRLVSNTLDTTVYSYPLREELVEDITDGEGRPAQRVIRYMLDANNTWLPKDVWWQTRDNVRAERSEENLRRVKLIFPPREGTQWNTNATNVEDEFGLEYEEVDEPFSVNGLSFDKTVSVVSTFQNNIVETRNYLERYAKGVGMIYHEVDSINAQIVFDSVITYSDYDRWYVRYTITGYGN
jgi:hypothetical protein